MRVPCVVINPYIKKGLIARPSGFVPFDHTSVIKTVQNCFKLQGNLTERDKAAPDFSGLLTLDAARTDRYSSGATSAARPPRPAPPHVNDLHRVIAKVLECTTGKPAPEDSKRPHEIHSGGLQRVYEDPSKRTASKS